jgi:hypothetical protein
MSPDYETYDNFGERYCGVSTFVPPILQNNTFFWRQRTVQHQVRQYRNVLFKKNLNAVTARTASARPHKQQRPEILLNGVRIGGAAKDNRLAII